MTIAGLVSAVFLLILLTCIGVGIYLIVTSRRATAGSGPRCGSCGYNLTGSLSNRCPECGSLFIEAGIVMQAVRTSRVRYWVGIGLLAAAVPQFCVGTGSVLAWQQARMARRTQATAQTMAAQARNQAIVAREAAEKARLEAEIQPTTAPATNPSQPDRRSRP